MATENRSLALGTSLADRIEQREQAAIPTAAIDGGETMFPETNFMPVPFEFANQFSDPYTDGYDAAKMLVAHISPDEADALRKLLPENGMSVEAALYDCCGFVQDAIDYGRDFDATLDELVELKGFHFPKRNPEYTNFLLGFIQWAGLPLSRKKDELRLERMCRL